MVNVWTDVLWNDEADEPWMMCDVNSLRYESFLPQDIVNNVQVVVDGWGKAVDG